MLSFLNTRSDFAATPCTIAVLPVGAVEQHGPHLPIGTDVLLAEALAQKLAEKLSAYLLPVIAISASIEHRKSKGTVYLRAETLALVMRDIVESLHHSGFRRLLVVNGHGGNWILKPAIRELNRALPEFRVVLLAPGVPDAEGREIFQHTLGDIHAGEMETSLMLHLHPDKVRRLPSGGSRDFPPQPLLDYFDSSELTPDGYWGWPELATEEKGRRAFEAMIAEGLRFLQLVEERDRGHRDGTPRREISLRPMRATDISFANELRQLAGWNQTEKDWQGYLEYEPDGCLVAEVDGAPAGTATTIRYGDRFGWIGMVLVKPDYRRTGVGTRLLHAAMAYLKDHNVACIKLDATPMGKKVYVPLGFIEEYGLARYEGTAPGLDRDAAGDSRPFSSADFGAIAHLDAMAFGAERPSVLASLASRNPDLCFARAEGADIVGYLIAREGAGAIQVGPWTARDADTAANLLHALFRRVAGRRVFIDVIDPNAAARELVARHGFTVQRPLTRMFLGSNAHPGETRLVFGISSAEKG